MFPSQTMRLQLLFQENTYLKTDNRVKIVARM